MSNSLQPHELWHARPLCRSPFPRACSDSCPLSWWCHPTTSSSIVPFSSCSQFPQRQGLFQWVRFLWWPSIGASALASVPPVSIQHWFPLGLTGFISWLSKWLSRVFFSTTFQKHQFLGAQLSLWSNSHIHTWLLERSQTPWTFVSKVKSLLFNMLSRFVIA